MLSLLLDMAPHNYSDEIKGPHAVDTLIQAVLTRRADAWKFIAVENVTLTDPRTSEIVLRN